MDPFQQQRETARRQEMERQRQVIHDATARQQQELQAMGERQRKQRQENAVEAENARLAASRQAWQAEHPDETPEVASAPQASDNGGYTRGTAWTDPSAQSRAATTREAKFAGPEARWPGSEIGQARDVTVQSPKNGIDLFLGFRLERYDARSGRLGPIAVRLVGDRALGFASEGDWVEVLGKSNNGLIDGVRAFNHTTRTAYRRSRRRILIPIVLVVFLGWAAFIGYMILSSPGANGNILNQVQQQQPGAGQAATPMPTLQPLPTLQALPTEQAPRPTYDVVGFQTCAKDGVSTLVECEARFPKYDP